MINQRQTILTFVSAAFLLFCVPLIAGAQSSYDPWYRRGDRDYRRDRRDDRRYQYDRRYLRDSVNRIDRLSGQLKGDLDRALDRSQLNGLRREDHINEAAHDFHEAAAKFKDRFDDGRDLGRAAGEARRVLEIGTRIDRVMSRIRLDGRVEAKWAQIREDLRVVADVYNIGYFDDGGRYERQRSNSRWDRPRW